MIEINEDDFKPFEFDKYIYDKKILLNRLEKYSKLSFELRCSLNKNHDISDKELKRLISTLRNLINAEFDYYHLRKVNEVLMSPKINSEKIINERKYIQSIESMIISGRLTKNKMNELLGNISWGSKIMNL